MGPEVAIPADSRRAWPGRAWVARAGRAAAVLGMALALAWPAGTAPATALRAQFWTDLDGIPQEGEDFPVSDAEAARRILEEAAWVFSGMIDGFEFEWTPANKGRQVEERFALTPLGAVAKGDPRLRADDTTRDRSRMSAWLEFRPDEADLRMLESSRGAAWKGAQGIGTAELTRGWPGRREAYVAAVKAGLESWARSVEPTRPRLVRGRVVLAAVPSLAIVAGAYSVQARLRLEIAELRKWELF